MKNIEASRYFEIEISTMEDISKKPTTYEIEYWLNQAYQRFIKTRYSGVNAKGLAFEQDQKRVEDLKKLINTSTIKLNENSITHEYTGDYPADHYITLGEDVMISTWTDPVDVFECTIENFTTKLNNSLTDVHSFHGYARPARLFTPTGVKLKTTGEYNITEYVLTYLKQPGKIAILTKPNDEFTELSEITHLEIIKLAVSMYLESKANPRYESFQNEVAQSE